jgi:hypothetical protein
MAKSKKLKRPLGYGSRPHKEGYTFPFLLGELEGIIYWEALSKGKREKLFDRAKKALHELQDVLEEFE